MTRYIFLVGIIIVAGGFFYWFGIRPENIRANCAASTDALLESAKSSAAELGPPMTAEEQSTQYNMTYEQCLHDSGL